MTTTATTTTAISSRLEQVQLDLESLQASLAIWESFCADRSADDWVRLPVGHLDNVLAEMGERLGCVIDSLEQALIDCQDSPKDSPQDNTPHPITLLMQRDNVTLSDILIPYHLHRHYGINTALFANRTIGNHFGKHIELGELVARLSHSTALGGVNALVETVAYLTDDTTDTTNAKSGPQSHPKHPKTTKH